jgi:uncharacterized repeat protein (TIGR01451 family)
LLKHLVWLGVVGVAFVVVVVAGATPTTNTPPSVSGTPEAGQQLTLTQGTYAVGDGPGPVTVTDAWERCDDNAGSGCVATGETGTTQQVTGGDVGKWFRVVETASDGTAPDAVTTTSSVGPVAAAPTPPQNTSLPTIHDMTPVVGQVLNATPGSWSGDPTSFDYAWCSPGCVSGSSQYTVQPGDVGKQFFVRVTATNGAGPSSADSATTAAVPPVPPQNTSLPTIHDMTPVVGQVLNATPGTWTGVPAPTYTYQWCSPGCVSGSSQYTVQPGDVGKQFFVRVTASNSGGSGAADSATTAAVPPQAPANTSLPTINNTAPTIGAVLIASPGSWTGAPAPTFTYQWCTPGCATVLGSGSQYTVLAADVGRTIIVRVTATNGGGVVSADSAATSAVPGIAPVNSALPALNQAAPVFVASSPPTLSVTNGTWNATPAVTSYSYEWQRCTSTAAASCAPFGAANQSTLTLQQVDVGSAFRVKVTATNGVNPDGVAFTAVTALVAQAPVNNGANGTVLPTITIEGDGLPDRGDTITGLSGTWFASPAPVLRHQWQRCNAAGTVCSNIGAPIVTGVTTTSAYQHTSSSQYVITDADLGSRIKLKVTAQIGSGTVVAPSPDNVLTPAARGVPVNVAGQPPALTGTLVRGQTLTASSGLWTGFWATGQPPLAFTHLWQRCDLAGSNCVDIAPPVVAPLAPGGAASCTSGVPCGGSTIYQLSDADMGSTIRVLVRATNGSGTTVEVATAVSAVVNGAPQILTVNGAPDPNAQPKISGLAQSGLNIGASTGSWSAFPGADTDSIAYAYQWVRCSGGDLGSCSPIGGATGAIYAVQDADVGQRLRIRITATNGVEPPGVAHSDPTDPVKAKSVGIGGDGVDLLLSAKASSSGGRLTYTLTVTNAGNRPASGVTVTANPPGGVPVVSANAPGGCSGGGPVSCAIGGLAPGANAAATIVVQATQTGVVAFSASVAGAEADVNPTNNGISVTTFLVVTGNNPQGSNATKVASADVPGSATDRTVALKSVKLKARKAGKTWAVSTRFSLVSGNAKLKLIVTKLGSEKPLTLLKGSRLGKAIASSNRKEITLNTAKPGTFPIKIVLPAAGFSLKGVYVIRITATSAAGASSRLDLGFKGAKLIKRKVRAIATGATWIAASRIAVPAGRTAVLAWVNRGKSTQRLALLKGSRLGKAAVKRTARTLRLTSTSKKKANLLIRVALPKRGFSLTSTYVIRVETKSVSGFWTDYEVSFKGKKPKTSARALTATP